MKANKWSPYIYVAFTITYTYIYIYTHTQMYLYILMNVGFVDVTLALDRLYKKLLQIKKGKLVSKWTSEWMSEIRRMRF